AVTWMPRSRSSAAGSVGTDGILDQALESLKNLIVSRMVDLAARRPERLDDPVAGAQWDAGNQLRSEPHLPRVDAVIVRRTDAVRRVLVDHDPLGELVQPDVVPIEVQYAPMARVVEAHRR